MTNSKLKGLTNQHTAKRDDISLRERVEHQLVRALEKSTLRIEEIFPVLECERPWFYTARIREGLILAVGPDPSGHFMRRWRRAKGAVKCAESKDIPCLRLEPKSTQAEYQVEIEMWARKVRRGAST